MVKTKKTKLAFLVMSVVLAFSMLMGVLSFQDHAKLMAKAGTETDITSTISLEDKGTVEAAGVVRTFFIQSSGANILTSGFAEYWNDNGAANAAKNNNVDLMEKVLIDGVSMRNIVNTNAASATPYKGPFFPFTNGGVYSPVQLGTSVNSFYLRVLIEFKSSYTLTIKSGFEVTTASGERLYTTKDVSFDVTENGVTKVEPDVPKTDVTSTLSLDHAANQNGVHIFYMRNNGAEIGTSFAQAYWNDNGVLGANNAAANFGVDLMAYILVDGVSMRDIINENASKDSENQYKGEEAPWSWGGLFSPVQVCTESGATLVRVLNDFKTEFRLTIKAGFTLLTKDDVKIYTTKDIKYAVTADSISKIEEYTLSFDAETAVSDITVTGGQAIGELPELPEKEGYDGVWTIDGVEINADTIYTYGADKTAVAVYKKDVTSTLSVDYVANQNGVNIFYMRNNGAEIGTSFAQAYWNDNGVSGANNAASNFGVDLMEYILVDGVSMRTLVNENAEKAIDEQYKGIDHPWNLGGVYAPVQVCTESAVSLIRVLNDFKTEYTLTIKEGFTLLTKDNIKIYTTKDIKYAVTADSICKIEGYILSFDAETAVGDITVIGGQAIGELPAVPEKEGYDGVWAIDGMEINADTVYTFGKDKTAVALYKKDVTSTLSIDHVANQNGVHIFYMRNNGAEIGSGFEQPYWNDNGVSGANNAASNCGVDIMAYILVDGVSMRDIINENASKDPENQYKGEEAPWSWGGLYSPVQVSTESGATLVRVLNDFKTEFTLTIKAGFTLVTKDGTVFYTTKDTYYKVTSDACIKVFAVSFNGANTIYVSENGVVEYPVDLSETKAEDAQYSYIYNWFLNGELYDFSSPVTADIDLTSDGTFTSILKKYIVTFNGENATEYEYGSKIEKPTVAPTKQPTVEYDYIFDAWYNGETEWDFENDTVTENVNLVAKYTETNRKYSVTFDGANATDYAYGSKIEKPADPTKESTAEFDYTFDAWYNGETEWDFENDTVVGNVNLVAKYTETKRSYTITINVTGNDVQIAPVQVEYGTDYDLSNLLEGIDLTNYIYSISVGGVEKISIRVVADVTVDVTFTKKSDASNKDNTGGCTSTIGGGMTVVSLAVFAIGFALFKKKEQ